MFLNTGALGRVRLPSIGGGRRAPVAVASMGPRGSKKGRTQKGTTSLDEEAEAPKPSDDEFGDAVLEALKKIQVPVEAKRRAKRAGAGPAFTPKGPRFEVIDGDAMLRAEQAAAEEEEEGGEYLGEEELGEEGQFVTFGFDPNAGVWDEDEEDVEGLEEESEADLAQRLRAAASQVESWPEDAEEEAEPGTSGRPRSSVSMEVRAFDTARLFVQAGDGGRGCVAFRREKFIPRGGPSGGNGGRGGNVWAVADSSFNSLMTFRRQLHFRAQPGNPGEGSNCAGADGDDTVIRVPPGTIIRRTGEDGSEILAEMLEDGERALLATGGRGGRGNASFKTSNNRTPILAEKGEAGQQYWLDLELKLVADVGIVGVPNAGKSTLLSVVSAAKPKIADYPFTTLTPNLGVCEMDMQTTIFADVPGLLEGAHTGKGLGQEFLRHCERCRVLIHVIDGTSPDPLHDFNAINLELELFSPDLADKPQVVAYNKMDLPDSSDYYDLVSEYFAEHGMEPPIPISAATGRGVVDLVRRVRAVLDALPPQETVRSTNNVTEAPRRSQSTDRVDDFRVVPDYTDGRRLFFVEGKALERFSQMTNFDYYESLKRFQKVLEAAGVAKQLRKAGVVEGDTVVIGQMEMQWSEDRSERALFDSWQRLRGDAPLQGSRAWPSPYE